jgi:predicted secreted hydrolase
MQQECRSLTRRQVIAGLGSWLVPVRAGVLSLRRAAADEASPPLAISLPRDDGPHQALTEWWYYTGHLQTDGGADYGFEQVTFQGRRGALAGSASHVAITDGGRQRFRYGQRAVIDKEATAKPGGGFDFAIGDWSMRGEDGVDELTMSLPGYAYALGLTSRKPPVLQGGDGYVRSDTGAESYYYSRTRLAVSGTLSVDGEASAVTGEAWMDHQWGNFTSFSEGGWNWLSMQLDDDTEVMIYQLRGATDVTSLGVATYVRADGSAVDLTAAGVVVDVDADWVSPHSGATYPNSWTVQLPGEELILKLAPTMSDQELDTRETTGLTYWEGEVAVTGTRAGSPIAGRGYVELTGYTRQRDGVVP